MAVCWQWLQRRRHVLAAVVLFVVLMMLWAQAPRSTLVERAGDVVASERLSTEMPSVAVDPEAADALQAEFESRRDHYQAVCDALQESGGVPGLVQSPLVYLPANLTVCWVPKVGCTFWKRVFFYLHDDGHSPWTSETVRSPFDIDRIFVHLHGGKKKTLNFDDAHEHDVIFHTNRVMFSRDPWSRLWSDYVDKFILPDSWLDHGKRILIMREQLAANQSRNSTRPLVTFGNLPGRRHHDKYVVQTQLCAEDVTFAEFLRYALLMNHDAHWSPVHLTCNPCVFRPQLVGKFETFSRDSSFILHASGLGDLLRDHDHGSHVKDEIKLLADYHFRLWDHRWELQTCLDHSGLARRLWTSFQLNGYIPSTSPFPEQTLGRQLNDVPLLVARDLFTQRVLALSSAWSLSFSDWTAFRRRTMVRAYRNVPRKLLQLVQERFRLDFELFEYDPAPADLFEKTSEV